MMNDFSVIFITIGFSTAKTIPFLFLNVTLVTPSNGFNPIFIKDLIKYLKDIAIKYGQEYNELKDNKPGEASATIRERVVKAREIQVKRLEEFGMHCNAQMTRQELVKFCKLDKEATKLMERYFAVLQLSARSHDRILKVARTIADLEGVDCITSKHLSEAISLRTSIKN